MKTTLERHLDKPHALYIFMAMLFVGLVVSGIGLQPFVFSDEWTYNLLARHTPLHESTIPSYLFLWLYRVTSNCGDGFLSCVRFLNALFFVASAPLIWSFGRNFCSARISLLLCILILVSPINTICYYFMPEAMYFFGFWLVMWFLQNHVLVSMQKNTYVAILGGILGVLALVKVHALFLALGIYLFLVWQKLSDTPSGAVRESFKSIFTSSVVLWLGFFGAKFSLGLLLAGKRAFTLFGASYGGHVGRSIESQTNHIERLAHYFQYGLTNFQGHILAACLLFGLPLLMLAMQLFSRSAATTSSDDLSAQQLTRLTICVFLPLLIVTSLFTVSIGGSDPSEAIRHLHQRYYNFAFGLLLFLLATGFRKNEELTKTSKTKNYALYFFVGIFVASIVYSMARFDTQFLINLSENPELKSLLHRTWFFYVACASAITLLVLALFKSHQSVKFWCLFYAPFFMVGSSYFAWQEIRQHIYPDVYDQAGQLAKSMLSPAALRRLTIAGEFESGLYRAQFAMDAPQAKLLALTPNAPLKDEQLDVETTWVLLFGRHPVSFAPSFLLDKPGYKLFRRNDWWIDFTQTNWPGLLRKIDGASYPENWGTWTVGEKFEMQFSKPLPQKFKLEFEAYASSANLGREFLIEIGSIKRSFKAMDNFRKFNFEFSIESTENTLKIIIPNPQVISGNDDPRALGLALKSMTIRQIF